MFYWGNATLVVPKDMFVDFAQEVLPVGPPVHIWIDFLVGANTDNSSKGFTTGLTALGHMELENRTRVRIARRVTREIF